MAVTPTLYDIILSNPFCSSEGSLWTGLGSSGKLGSQRQPPRESRRSQNLGTFWYMMT